MFSDDKISFSRLDLIIYFVIMNTLSKQQRSFIMKFNYSFLKDELALNEIRKHKWIESERQKRDIGFATAAVEWIKKHGLAWKEYRLRANNDNSIFSEKRRFRRFPLQFPVEIKVDDSNIISHTNDFNIVGLSCNIPKPIKEEATAEVVLKVRNNTKTDKDRGIQFSSRVVRSTKVKKGQTESFNVFLPFDEETRKLLKAHLSC